MRRRQHERAPDDEIAAARSHRPPLGEGDGAAQGTRILAGWIWLLVIAIVVVVALWLWI